MASKTNDGFSSQLCEITRWLQMDYFGHQFWAGWAAVTLPSMQQAHCDVSLFPQFLLNYVVHGVGTP